MDSIGIKENEPSVYETFVYKVLKSLYVDDLNSGSSNVTEGYELYEKTKSIMLKAGMNMRKWWTNSQELMEIIEANETVVSPEPVSITDEPTCDTNTVAVNSPTPSETTGKILGILCVGNSSLTVRHKMRMSTCRSTHPERTPLLIFVSSLKSVDFFSL